MFAFSSSGLTVTICLENPEAVNRENTEIVLAVKIISADIAPMKRPLAIDLFCGIEGGVLKLSNKPLMVDLFCGLGGWADGGLAEGYDVIGFDTERHAYGNMAYPGKLVVQDVCTLHGSQFKNAALIVASPPCQEYSYMAMPWKLAKAKAKAIREDASGEKLAALNRLFNECFRIQKEASLAAKRHIPLVVENVRGAIPWVGRSRWNFGSFHLWGDVPALMPITLKAIKVPGFRFDGSGKSFQSASVQETGHKSQGLNWSDRSKKGQDFTRIAGQQAMSGTKTAQDDEGGYGGGFGWDNTPLRRGNSKSSARKQASAMIAKIPLPLSRHIATVYRP